MKRLELVISLLSVRGLRIGNDSPLDAQSGALAIISGTIAGILGAQWTGSVIGGLVVVGLVYAFIYGRRGN